MTCAHTWCAYGVEKRSAHTLNMKSVSESEPSVRAPRARQAHNLYLDSTVAAKSKTLAENSRHKSLSALVEHLLVEHLQNRKTHAA